MDGNYTSYNLMVARRGFIHHIYCEGHPQQVLPQFRGDALYFEVLAQEQGYIEEALPADEAGGAGGVAGEAEAAIPMPFPGFPVVGGFEAGAGRPESPDHEGDYMVAGAGHTPNYDPRANADYDYYDDDSPERSWGRSRSATPDWEPEEEAEGPVAQVPAPAPEPVPEPVPEPEPEPMIVREYEVIELDQD